jgi:hypothetical protein
MSAPMWNFEKQSDHPNSKTKLAVQKTGPKPVWPAGTLAVTLWESPPHLTQPLKLNARKSARVVMTNRLWLEHTGCKKCVVNL